MMTRRDWWIGVAVVGTALLLHVAMPRYEYRSIPGGDDVTDVLIRNAIRGNDLDNMRVFLLQIDRWTGRARTVQVDTYGQKPFAE